MTRLAVRAAPVFAAIETVTFAVPVPLAGLTAAQDERLLAVQPQVARLEFTVTVAVEATGSAAMELVASVYVQAAAAWVTVRIWPATVSVAVRAAPVFAATVIVTVPEPVPLIGLTVAQAASLDAVHPHVERFAVTVAPLVAPVAAAESDVAERAYVQPADG